jgi:hypothetical protein
MNRAPIHSCRIRRVLILAIAFACTLVDFLIGRMRLELDLPPRTEGWSREGRATDVLAELSADFPQVKDKLRTVSLTDANAKMRHAARKAIVARQWDIHPIEAIRFRCKNAYLALMERLGRKK